MRCLTYLRCRAVSFAGFFGQASPVVLVSCMGKFVVSVKLLLSLALFYDQMRRSDVKVTYDGGTGVSARDQKW